MGFKEGLAAQVRKAGEHLPFRHREQLPPMQQLQKEVADIIKSPDPDIEYMIMSGVDGQNECNVHLYDREIQTLPTQQVFGVFDRHGRQGRFYAWVPGEEKFGDLTRKTAIHPSVIHPRIVFVAHHIYNPDNTERMQTWGIQRREPWHTELFQDAIKRGDTNTAIAIKEGYAPVDPLEVREKVY